MNPSSQFHEFGNANVPARDSGLPGEIVVFASNEGAGGINPRIEVSNIRGKSAYHRDTFSVRVSDAAAVIEGLGTPRGFSISELHAVFSWVVLNKQVLLDYWVSDDYSTLDFLQDLKSL